MWEGPVRVCPGATLQVGAWSRTPVMASAKTAGCPSKDVVCLGRGIAHLTGTDLDAVEHGNALCLFPRLT